MSKFKAGDKVYYPKRSRSVLTVYEDGLPSYPIHLQGRTEDFTRDGKSLEGDMTPSIFHATEENHALLEKLYGRKFEAPPTKPTSREIIKAMLERGDKNVLCWVGNTRKEVESGYLWKFITEYNENSDYPYVSEGRGSVGSWVFAVPIDHKTEQPITELPQ